MDVIIAYESCGMGGGNLVSRPIQETHMKEPRKVERKPRTVAVTKPATRPAPAKAATAARKKAMKVSAEPTPSSPVDDRDVRIRVAAYFRAEHRGFVPGYELEDWLAAESDSDASPTSPRGSRKPSGNRRRPKDEKL
jgi:hypothetical protein